MFGPDTVYQHRLALTNLNYGGSNMAKANRRCSVDGCNDNVVARGWCDAHYRRWKRHGTTDTPQSLKKTIHKQCRVDGCGGNPNVLGTAKGYCPAHYNRLKRHGSPTGGNVAPGSVHEWLREVSKSDAPECIFRSGIQNRGKVTYRGVGMHYARMVAFLAHGEPDTGFDWALHKCRNGAIGCCNPNHIYWGSPKQNTQDQWRDETRPHGEAATVSKLTDAQVFEMRGLVGSMSVRCIARRYPVSEGQVRRIIRRERWAWM